MMNEKQICAGNIAIVDITFMCRPGVETFFFFLGTWVEV
jgi:hypothetical protein